MVKLPSFATLFVLISPLLSPLSAHEVLMGGKGKLSRVSAGGDVIWEMPWSGIHDIHLLPNGNILTTHRNRRVVEIDPQSKTEIWSYDCSKANGNDGKKVEVHACQPLPNGHILIAESGSARLLEVDRAGRIHREIPLKTLRPHHHSDTRLVRKLPSGTYLVAQESDGFCREYASDGTVLWEYEVPLFGKQPAKGHGPEGFGNRLFSALRLPNGNTLIGTGNGHSVIEVSPEKEIVWQLHQHDLPGMTLAWVTTLEVLENGNYVIGNCHAGPNQPLLVEVVPETKEVVWTFDQFALFGNSAPNSVLIDQRATSLR